MSSEDAQRDLAHLFDILDAAELALSYVEGMDAEVFSKDARTQDAVLRRLTIIGEAAKRVSPATRSRYPYLPWRQMAGLRDVVVHDYDDVDLNIIWQALSRELPPLIPEVSKILHREP